MVDSSVVGSLLNFFKEIFGFPYAGYATDGNESLSLCLFSYRQEWEEQMKNSNKSTSWGEPRILYFLSEAEQEDSLQELKRVAKRLGMVLVAVEEGSEEEQETTNAAVIMTSFENPRHRGCRKLF